MQRTEEEVIQDRYTFIPCCNIGPVVGYIRDTKLSWHYAEGPLGHRIGYSEMDWLSVITWLNERDKGYPKGIVLTV